MTPTAAYTPDPIAAAVLARYPRALDYAEGRSPADAYLVQQRCLSVDLLIARLPRMDPATADRARRTIAELMVDLRAEADRLRADIARADEIRDLLTGAAARSAAHAVASLTARLTECETALLAAACTVGGA